MIQLTGIAKSYGKGEGATVALDGVDFAVKPRERVAIMGPSGSGKSTLLNIIGLLDTPDTGRYLLCKEDALALNDKKQSFLRNQTFGFIFQDFNLLPRFTAIENVEMPLRYASTPRSQRRERALHALEAVGLADRAEHTPAELSGGQQQRVAIARALVTNPKVILADEPTGNLDSVSAQGVMQLLDRLSEDGLTIVMITHAPDIAGHAERIVYVRDGKVADEEFSHVHA